MTPPVSGQATAFQCADAPPVAHRLPHVVEDGRQLFEIAIRHHVKLRARWVRTVATKRTTFQKAAIHAAESHQPSL